MIINKTYERYKIIFLVVLIIFIFYPVFLYADEKDTRITIHPGHSFLYLIYNKSTLNLPILYTIYSLSTDYEGGEEYPAIQIFMNPGTYIMHSEPSYNTTDFEIELTENEKKKRFSLDLKENKFYYASIIINDRGYPTLKWLNEKEGKKLVRKFSRALPVE